MYKFTALRRAIKLYARIKFPLQTNCYFIGSVHEIKDVLVWCPTSVRNSLFFCPKDVLFPVPKCHMQSHFQVNRQQESWKNQINVVKMIIKLKTVSMFSGFFCLLRLMIYFVLIFMLLFYISIFHFTISIVVWFGFATSADWECIQCQWWIQYRTFTTTLCLNWRFFSVSRSLSLLSAFMIDIFPLWQRYG